MLLSNRGDWRTHSDILVSMSVGVPSARNAALSSQLRPVPCHSYAFGIMMILGFSRYPTVTFPIRFLLYREGRPRLRIWVIVNQCKLTLVRVRLNALELSALSPPFCVQHGMVSNMHHHGLVQTCLANRTTFHIHVLTMRSPKVVNL